MSNLFEGEKVFQQAFKYSELDLCGLISYITTPQT